MTYAIAAGFVGLVIGLAAAGSLTLGAHGCRVLAGRFRRSRKTTIIVDKRRRGL